MLALNRKFQHAIWEHTLAATPAISLTPQISAHATPHSKGAWTTIMTTTYDVYGFWLSFTTSALAATQTDMMIDIATGPAQENIIIPEYLCGWRGSTGTGFFMHWFPIFIPAGTLVSGRLQALITVDTIRLLMYANGSASGIPGPLFSGCDAYGTSTAASQGTSHTPGNSGAESTAANIGGTTSKHYDAVMLGLGGTLTQTLSTDITYHWELQIGSVTVCEWIGRMTSSETQLGPFPPTPFHVSIPSGTQLQVRGEASGTAQEQDVAFYCFY